MVKRVIINFSVKLSTWIFPALVFFSCQSEFFQEVQTTIHEDNVLHVKINYLTEPESDTFVAYWRDGHEGAKQYSALSSSNKNHEIDIINILPNEKYHFIIRGKQGENTIESNIYSFKTDSLPAVVPEYRLTKKEFSFDGYILLKKYNEAGSFLLLDDSARVVWYSPYDSTVLRPFQWTDDQSIVSLRDSTTIEEFDLYGNIINEINIKEIGISKRIHHELFKNERGHFVFLNYDYKYLDLSALGGKMQDTIRTDGMMIIDQRGKLIWEWSVFDVLDPMDDPKIMQQKNDWGHANSISYDVDGDFIISFRDFNQVWKVDAKNGVIKWRIGEDGDYNLPPENQTIKQHAAHINPKGELMIYDNGNIDRGHSRIISYQINENEKTADIRINIPLGKSMTTFRMGSAYMIDDNHILVCSPKKKLGLGIYDLEGNLVWKVEGSSDSYRAIYIKKREIENSKPF